MLPDRVSNPGPLTCESGALFTKFTQSYFIVDNLQFKKKIHFRITRTVRKSDYTPALALPKHVAGILDEKCREKEKYREQQIGECPFSIPVYYPSF